MSKLTPEQENELLKSFLINDTKYEGRLIRFARLYHTEASKHRNISPLNIEEEEMTDMEEKLIMYDLGDLFPNIVIHGVCFTASDLLAFARYYHKQHTEASKAGMSGEVKSAEEILKKICLIREDADSAEVFMTSVPFPNAIRAMIEYAAQFQQGWRPIEEAPKDWRDVLLYVPEHVYQDEFNEDSFAEEEVVIGYFSAPSEGNSKWHYTISGVTLMFEPTRWQPLPSPPNEKP